MLSRDVRWCPFCKDPLEIRVRFVSASPSSDRADRYLWCARCRRGMRIQEVDLTPMVSRTRPKKLAMPK